jgi:TolB-like protein/DNA-binding winged helix-turn-helix (wHTH) protein/Tfp pilus assembly protein PilF
MKQEDRSSVEIFRFGPFQVDVVARQVTKDGVRIRVSEQPFKLLMLLIASPGKVITRETLQAKLWSPDTYVDFERGLTIALNRLRTALADSAENPRYIETVPRLGYRFIAPVSVDSNERPVLPTPESISEPSVPIGLANSLASPRAPVPPITTVHVAKRSERYYAGSSAYIFSGIAALVFFVTIIAVLWPRLTHSDTASRGQVRMLILPFENLTGDASQEYVCDGMTEELIAQLGSMDPKRLSVLARTTAMHYKGSRKSIKDIASELGVDYVLESSIRRVDNHIRVTTQLIQGPQELHLWAQSFDRDSSDILGLQQSVALAVANEVPFRLSRLKDSPWRETRPANPEAYADYLRGRFFWNKRNREGLNKGVMYFKQAIKEDEKYAPAYAGLADSYLVLGGGYWPSHQTYLQGEAAAADALALDGNLAEAHTSLAYFKFIDERDWPGADREVRRAITLDPGYATAHHWYALYLSAMDRMPEAFNEIQKALELDPLSVVISSNAGAIYYQSGDYERSEKQLRKALELDPNFVPAYGYLGYVYQMQGRYEEALAEYKKGQQISGDPLSFGGDVGRIYGTTGKKREAVAMLRQLEETAKRQPNMAAYSICLVYASLGEVDNSLKWLAKSIEYRECTATELTHDLRLAPLRSSTEFQTFRRQLKLPN